MLGDKGRARAVADAAGVPTLPGWSGDELSDAEIVERVGEGDLPLLVKAAAGGGGKGMRLVERREDLAEALGAARREAAAAFGDERLLIERFVEPSRHLEIQVIADSHGNAIHLGERECSLQRRHQKVIEESPSPVVTEEMREAMGAAAVALRRAGRLRQRGHGRADRRARRPEPLLLPRGQHAAPGRAPGDRGGDRPRPGRAAAAGGRGRGAAAGPGGGEAQRLGDRGARLRRGPGGRVPALERRGRRLPRGPPGVRVDSGIEEGTVVGTDYDPMLAKVVGARGRPGRGAGAAAPRAGRDGRRRPDHERRLPARPAGAARGAGGGDGHRPDRAPRRRGRGARPPARAGGAGAGGDARRARGRRRLVGPQRLAHARPGVDPAARLDGPPSMARSAQSASSRSRSSAAGRDRARRGGDVGMGGRRGLGRPHLRRRPPRRRDRC